MSEKADVWQRTLAHMPPPTSLDSSCLRLKPTATFSFFAAPALACASYRSTAVSPPFRAALSATGNIIARLATK